MRAFSEWVARNIKSGAEIAAAILTEEEPLAPEIDLVPPQIQVMSTQPLDLDQQPIEIVIQPTPGQMAIHFIESEARYRIESEEAMLSESLLGREQRAHQKLLAGFFFSGIYNLKATCAFAHKAHQIEFNTLMHDETIEFLKISERACEEKSLISQKDALAATEALDRSYINLLEIRLYFSLELLLLFTKEKLLIDAIHRLATTEKESHVRRITEKEFEKSLQTKRFELTECKNRENVSDLKKEAYSTLQRQSIESEENSERRKTGRHQNGFFVASTLMHHELKQRNTVLNQEAQKRALLNQTHTETRDNIVRIQLSQRLFVSWDEKARLNESEAEKTRQSKECQELKMMFDDDLPLVLEAQRTRESDEEAYKAARQVTFR